MGANGSVLQRQGMRPVGERWVSVGNVGDVEILQMKPGINNTQLPRDGAKPNSTYSIFMRNGKDVKTIAKYDENGIAKWEIHNDNHHGIKPHIHLCNEKGYPISNTGSELTPELASLFERVRNFRK